MNKQPVLYLQTDARWKDLRLPCTGGTMSLGGGGCGPTSAAMLIETLTGKPCLPTETFRWCCEHGYMYANQGTAYDYFAAQFKAYGIDCGMIPSVCMSASSPVRRTVETMLRDGCYFIALMKKGLWTNGGHYVVVWREDGKVRINDPASTKNERVNGDPDTFFAQAKYFWQVDAREYNREDEDDMKRYQTLDEIKKEAPWAHDTIQKLCAARALSGDGTGLDLSYDMLRQFVANDRMGLYK
ncbi:MAG: C39 family peptidase [Pyramidobacter sp.]|nr:C39 family peptidase [Pyramidobacter sp.]